MWHDRYIADITQVLSQSHCGLGKPWNYYYRRGLEVMLWLWGGEGICNTAWGKDWLEDLSGSCICTSGSLFLLFYLDCLILVPQWEELGIRKEMMEIVKGLTFFFLRLPIYFYFYIFLFSIIFIGVTLVETFSCYFLALPVRWELFFFFFPFNCTDDNLEGKKHFTNLPKVTK